MGSGAEGLQAELSQNGQVMMKAAGDEAGNLALDNLTPGEYDLSIQGGNFEIFVQNLKV